MCIDVTQKYFYYLCCLESSHLTDPQKRLEAACIGVAHLFIFGSLRLASFTTNRVAYATNRVVSIFMNCDSLMGFMGVVLLSAHHECEFKDQQELPKLPHTVSCF